MFSFNSPTGSGISVIVRVVRSPENFVGPELTGDPRRSGVVRVHRDPALTLEILAGLAAAIGKFMWINHLVNVIQPV